MHLFDYPKAIKYYHTNKIDFILWITTFSGCLLVGVMWGLLIAIMIVLAKIVLRYTYPKVIILNNGINNLTKTVMIGQSHLDFINIDYIINKLIENRLDDGYLLINMQSIDSIDSYSLQQLTNLLTNLNLILFGVNTSLQSQLLEAGFSRDHLVETPHMANKQAFRLLKRPLKLIL